MLIYHIQPRSAFSRILRLQIWPCHGYINDRRPKDASAPHVPSEKIGARNPRSDREDTEPEDVKSSTVENLQQTNIALENQSKSPCLRGNRWAIVHSYISLREPGP